MPPSAVTMDEFDEKFGVENFVGTNDQIGLSMI